MTNAADDYWPTDIGEPNAVTPASMMRAQASLLGSKTNQQVTASVVSIGGSPAEFIWSFQLLSSTLGNYRYELFRVSHPLTLFPVVVNWEGHANKVITTEQEFKEHLKEIIGSEQTKKIVQGILAQVVRR